MNSSLFCSHSAPEKSVDRKPMEMRRLKRVIKISIIPSTEEVN